MVKNLKLHLITKINLEQILLQQSQLNLRKNSSIEDKMQVIVAAKRVEIIDGYAESLNIDKFDLAIDWGFLYFITKPLFHGIDYFFKLLGNYGLAIIAITFCIRLAFFPTCKLLI